MLQERISLDSQFYRTEWTLCHDACLEPFYTSINFVFDNENPLITHKSFSWWQLSHVPCFVLFKCLNLLQDGCFPFRYFDYLSYGIWYLYLIEITNKSTEARRKTLIGYKIIDKISHLFLKAISLFRSSLGKPTLMGSKKMLTWDFSEVPELGLYFWPYSWCIGCSTLFWMLFL